MYTKADLILNLKEMGIKPTDVLMVHSSMKSIGEVEGGADTVVDVFMEYLSDGLFMTPTHTWAQMNEEYSVFDPLNEPACVGIIPNIFRKRPGVLRSLHPTHSIAAYGKHAQEYIAGEEDATTPCPKGGCWDRLKDVKAKILLVGVTHARNTYIHSVDEVFDVQERLTLKPTLFHVVMPDGTKKEVYMYRHYNPVSAHISENFDKLSDAFIELGAAKNVKFGDAECILCEADKIFDIYRKIIEIEPNCLIERETIPEHWWNKMN